MKLDNLQQRLLDGNYLGYLLFDWIMQQKTKLRYYLDAVLQTLLCCSNSLPKWKVYVPFFNSLVLGLFFASSSTSVVVVVVLYRKTAQRWWFLYVHLLSPRPIQWFVTDDRSKTDAADLVEHWMECSGVSLFIFSPYDDLPYYKRNKLTATAVESRHLTVANIHKDPQRSRELWRK